METDALELGTIQKSNDEQVVVKLINGRNGNKYIDIRTYWTPSGNQFDYTPTKKGVRLHAELLDELLGILELGKA